MGVILRNFMKIILDGIWYGDYENDNDEDVVDDDPDENVDE